MAGEKTSKKAEVINEVETITLTQESLKDIISSAVKAAVDSVSANNPSVAANQKVISEDLTANLATQLNKKTQEGQKYLAAFANSKDRVYVQIDSIYKEYLGKALTVTFNGSTIKVPVDGKRYLVHPLHADIIEEKKRYVSELIARNAGNDNFTGSNEVGDFSKI